jgi:small subunit ribosomal protein S21
MKKYHKRRKMINPGHSTSVRVPKSKDGQRYELEAAIKEFKRLTKESGKLQEVRERKEFKSKSLTRREQIQKAVYRQQRRSAAIR